MFFRPLVYMFKNIKTQSTQPITYASPLIIVSVLMISTQFWEKNHNNNMAHFKCHINSFVTLKTQGLC